MKKLLWSVLLLTIAATGKLFADNNKNTKESLKQYLDPAALETLSQQIVNGEESGIVIIDVRPENTYRKAHIPGAMNIPNGLTNGKYEDLKMKDMVLYCETGIRVEFAKKNLIKDGFDITRMLNFGGFSRYKGKTEKGE
ncbi:MAG: rhodanese-like domain-containing protein [Treponema sp.]|nr:rhodanese-like domain-containing protein [Treponema sp.]